MATSVQLIGAAMADDASFKSRHYSTRAKGPWRKRKKKQQHNYG